MNLHCASCHTAFNLGDRFCEECGVSLATAQTAIQLAHQTVGQTDVKSVSDSNPLSSQNSIQVPCIKCNSLDIDLDGFCNQCGHRNPTARDHQEVVFCENFAAISDRGIRHSRNEDAFAIDRLSDGTHVLVVCDGVSSSTDPGSASSLASQTACQSIVHDLNQDVLPDVALKNAIARASTAVTDLGHKLKATGEPPSTTIVCAIVLPPTSPSVAIHLAWVGDSRAYWLSDSAEDSIALTQDHSWMNEVVAAGEMPLTEAEASPNAHAITRWLGADSHNDEGPSHDEPSFAQHIVTQPGRLMVCSDGLWNYAPAPSALRELIHEDSIHEDLMQQLPTDRDTIHQIKHCLNFALECGGQDNITIAVLNIPDK